MSERFYINCDLKTGEVVLEGSDAHHLSAVCRFRPGDPVILFNGDGHEYPAHIVSVSKRTVVLQVSSCETSNRELDFAIEVAAPVPKGDRAQFLLEKLAELGVHGFVPLRTQRSVVHPSEGKQEKLARYVIEASKQCGRNVLMEVLPLTVWTQYCKAGLGDEVRILAHPSGDNLSGLGKIAQSLVRLAVGPEGGWTDQEVELARQEGWRIVSLGPRILRVETAALVLAAWASGGR